MQKARARRDYEILMRASQGRRPRQIADETGTSWGRVSRVILLHKREPLHDKPANTLSIKVKHLIARTSRDSENISSWIARVNEREVPSHFPDRRIDSLRDPNLVRKLMSLNGCDLTMAIEIVDYCKKRMLL
ncbi:MAG: hypothetical protein WCT31_00740 [Candidatus Micrarchaeia archaeon]|jgi:hypothetical protein